MSVLTPDEIVIRAEQGDDVIRGFCHFIHFFISDWAARQWISEHPDTTEMSIEEGFELGRRWVSHAFGIGAA
jgi:alkylmercury lyase